ncbi:MAG: hypothetical protein ACRELY_02405 [Polyangiaceae bacterium]
MPITGSHPEKGFRIELSLEGKNCYRGAIVTPDGRFDAIATIDESGAVLLTTDAPPDLAEKTRLVVRTVVRHAAAEKTGLPRRIVRWRGEK